MTTQHRKVLHDFAELLKVKKIPFEQLFLYGSAARGEEHAWSDVDVAVIGPSFEKDRIAETVKLRLVSYEIDPALVPVPLRPEDLNDVFSTIGQAVKKEGQEIK